MGAALNGMALHGGLRPYGATFLIFSDYMRPAMRLAALMNQPVIYILTHDSIGLGEDGPTHQPVEQIMTMRMIPNMRVWRPADARETAACWKAALLRKDGPSVLALSRQKLAVLDEVDEAGVLRGGYVLKGAAGAKVALVATGSEVHLALAAQTQLAAEGVAASVVSIPSLECFLAQDAAYRASVLPEGLPVVAVEAGLSWGWERVADRIVGLDRFGASAPAEILFDQFGFTAANVASVAQSLLN
jgi:transketolase